MTADTGELGSDGGAERVVLGAEDIAALNRQAVARAAAFVRLAGTALVVAGAVAVVAWVWTMYRQQEAADAFADLPTPTVVGAPGEDEEPVFDFFSPFGGFFDVSFADRIDLLVSEVDLAVVGLLALGLGLALRLAADYTVARTGGSLTGYEVGDEL